MDALRIKNLRCLTDTGRVPIRPITLLVGKNSSGKSTFLRAFPLLRQSVETARESPILWYHDRYVDFGSFDEALNERAKERVISFEFELPIRHRDIHLDRCAITVNLMDAGDGRRTYVHSYRISAEDHHIDIELSPEGELTRLRVDDDASFDLSRTGLRFTESAFLLPTFSDQKSSEPITFPRYRERPTDWIEEIEFYPLIPKDAVKSHVAELANSLMPDMSATKIGELIDFLIAQTRPAPWDRRLELLAPAANRAALRSALFPWMLATFADQILTTADAHISDLAAHVGYLAPLRADARRGYRVQDLSVSEVDPRGDNLAMFLRSLSQEEVQSFADFTRRHMDFDTSLRILGLHADILIREAPGGRAKNLVDVGSGFAQVLPLAAILWSTCVRKPRRENGHTSLLAIEQPELHLHPAYQARLTRMFAGAMLDSRAAKRPVKLLIETHSEALINGFGDLVHDKVLSPDDVQIAIFDQDEATRDTTVRLASYDEDGALRNWPYGFFNAIDDRRDAAG